MNVSTIKKSELMIDVIQYAADHGLDVSKKKDVQTILDNLDPNYSEDFGTFFELLQTSNTYLNMSAGKMRLKKPKLPH